MPYASGLLAADISGIGWYLETLSLVAFAFLMVELADLTMGLQRVVDVADARRATFDARRVTFDRGIFPSIRRGQ